jgi:hypothetical protein
LLSDLRANTHTKKILLGKKTQKKIPSAAKKTSATLYLVLVLQPYSPFNLRRNDNLVVLPELSVSYKETPTTLLQHKNDQSQRRIQDLKKNCYLSSHEEIIFNYNEVFNPGLSIIDFFLFTSIANHLHVFFIIVKYFSVDVAKHFCIEDLFCHHLLLRHRRTHSP